MNKKKIIKIILLGLAGIGTAFFLLFWLGFLFYYFYLPPPSSTPDKINEYKSNIIQGIVVVGFKKDISLMEAEKILQTNNFQKEENVFDHLDFRYSVAGFPNMGKIFQNETEARFMLTVPRGEEEKWINIFNKEPTVYKAGYWLDPEEVLVD